MIEIHVFVKIITDMVKKCFYAGLRMWSGTASKAGNNNINARIDAADF